jgi:hypothetical protein
LYIPLIAKCTDVIAPQLIDDLETKGYQQYVGLEAWVMLFDAG